MTNESVCSIIIKSSGNDECGSGGTGRRARLRGVWFTPYGFKSRFPHQQKEHRLRDALFVGAEYGYTNSTAMLFIAVRSNLLANSSSERSERRSTVPYFLVKQASLTRCSFCWCGIWLCELYRNAQRCSGYSPLAISSCREATTQGLSSG